MRKSLLFTAALLAATTTVSAQQKLQMFSKINLKAANALRVMPMAKQKASAADKSSIDIQKAAVRKAYADGLFYYRPQGTYYYAGTSQQTGEDYCYLMLPSFTDLTFEKPESINASWYLGGEDVTQQAEEDGNFKMSYRKNFPNYVQILPSLSNGSSTFQIADYANALDSISDGSYLLMPFNYNVSLAYMGFSDGTSPFGSIKDTFDYDGDQVEEDIIETGFFRFFEKPAAPLYLHELAFYWQSKNATPIAEGSSLKAYIRRVVIDEKGNGAMTDTLAVLTASPETIVTAPSKIQNQYNYGIIGFSQTVEDEFGTQTIEPVTINDNFAVYVDGLDQPGIDINFYFCDLGEDMVELASYPQATYQVFKFTDGTPCPRPLSYFGTYADDNGETSYYCYNPEFLFYGEMDGIMVEDEINKQVVPAEGGESESEIKADDGTGYDAYLWTTYPIFDGEEDAGNYSLEGAPEWAMVLINPYYYDYSDMERGENLRGLNLVHFSVEPLPEGVTGRVGEVYVEGIRGSRSNRPIYIVQGDAEITDGVKAIQFDKDGKFLRTYNMKGQAVSNDAKGLIIKNGKKFFNK